MPTSPVDLYYSDAACADDFVAPHHVTNFPNGKRVSLLKSTLPPLALCRFFDRTASIFGMFLPVFTGFFSTTKKPPDDGQQLPASPVPFGQQLQALLVKIGPRFVTLQELLHPVEPFMAMGEMRFDLFPQEPAHDPFEHGFCGEITGTIPINLDFPDGVHLQEKPQSLAGGTFAEFQAVDDLRHREGLFGDKEEPVDFRDRTWLCQQAGDSDEKLDHFRLKSIKGLLGWGGSRVGNGHKINKSRKIAGFNEK